MDVQVLTQAAAKDNPPGRGSETGRQEVQQSRFAGAGLADDADNLAAVEIETNILTAADPAIKMADAGDAQ